jgi:hypothetical protein
MAQVLRLKTCEGLMILKIVVLLSFECGICHDQTFSSEMGP